MMELYGKWRITKVIAINPEVVMNVCKTTNVNPLVVLEEKSGFSKVIRIHYLGTMNICTEFYDHESDGLIHPPTNQLPSPEPSC